MKKIDILVLWAIISVSAQSKLFRVTFYQFVVFSNNFKLKKSFASDLDHLEIDIASFTVKFVVSNFTFFSKDLCFKGVTCIIMWTSLLLLSVGSIICVPIFWRRNIKFGQGKSIPEIVRVEGNTHTHSERGKEREILESWVQSQNETERVTFAT